MAADQRQILVVLGMHRGGTSALARGLLTLGVSLGDNLWEAKPENERGFWEDRDVYALNEELLIELGETWNSVRLFDARKISPHRLEELLIKGQTLLAGKLAGGGTYGFKDPRTSRLLFYWQRVFVALSLDPCYIIAARNPISVARSLLARNGLRVEQSYLLWMEHMLSALHGTEGCRRVIVDYDLLLQDPTREIQRTRESLAMPVPRGMEQLLADYCTDFLSEDLRHTQFDADAVGQTEGMPACAVRLHRLLTDLAADRISPEDADCRDKSRQLWERLTEMSAALIFAEHGYRESAALHAVVAERDTKINELEATSATQAARIAELEQSLRLATSNLHLAQS